MQTQVIKHTNGKTSLSEAADILRRGGLVAFATETVYGLGGNALNEDAAKKIYAAKGRPSDNPLIVHIAEPEDAEKYAYTNELYYKLARAFMPGPLTVILPKKNTVPSSVTGGLDTVALRCPSHPTARALIKESGLPIAAPSANISGRPSPTSAEHVVADLSGKIDMIIDGGESEIGLESTIVKIEDNKLVMLRPGGITFDALACVCENVEIAYAVTEALAPSERVISPGMKYRHYSPSTPLVLLDGERENVIAFMKKAQENEKCIIISYTEEVSELKKDRLIEIGSENDLDSQAKRLFAVLRETESYDADIIYAHLPKKDGLGLALYNRLIRAAAHTIKKV